MDTNRGIRRYPDDQSVAASAKAWVDSLSDKWRVQVLARRVRALKDGTKKEIPSRLRRFVEGVPWAFVRPAIDYLISLAPYSGVIANGVDFGVPYRPTLTVWQRDSQQAAVGAKGASVGDATYTLVQDLVEADADDIYTVGTSSSCSEEVVSDYVWDAASVEPLPAGGMGVTYQIAQVHRNEDGTFDYAIVKRTALTQHAGPALQESNAIRQVSVELWDNVYVDADGRYCDDGMSPLGIPDPGLSVDGDGNVVETKLTQISENPDCTLRLSVVRETSLAVGVKSSSSHTRYEGTHEETEAGRTAPLGLAPDAAGGVIREYTSQRQSDGSFQVTEHTTVERPVVQSRVETTIGRRGVRVSVRDTNMPVPADLESLAADGSESDASTVYIAGRPFTFGSVVSEKTPGGLYTNTVSRVDRRLPVDAGFRCEDDLYTHSHSVTTGGGDLGDIRSTHAAGGVGGVVQAVEASIDDEGSVTRTVREDREKKVDEASVSYRVTREGVVETVKGSSQPASGAAYSYRYNWIGAGRGAAKTKGGLYDNEITAPVYTNNSLAVAASSAKTLEESVFSRDTVTASAPTAELFSNLSAAAPANGVHREKSVRVTEVGTYVTTERTTTENRVVHASRTHHTPRMHLNTVTVHNTSSNSGTQADLGGMGGVVSDLSWERTPGGRYNVTKTTASPNATPDSGHCERTVYEHRHDDVTFGTSRPTGDVQPAGGGRHRRQTFEVDEYGIVKTVLTTVTETPVMKAEVTYDCTAKGVRTTVLDRNQAAPLAMQAVAGAYGTWRSTQNPGGSFDNVRTTFTPSSAVNRVSCSKDVFLHEHVVGSGASPDALDGLDVQAAGDGVYRSKEATLDDSGAVEVVERTSTEIPVPQAMEAVEADAFHRVHTVEGKSLSASPSEAEASPGHKIRRQSTVTKGNRVDVVTVDDTAVYQQWDDQLETDLYLVYMFYFRNADEGQRAARRQNALNMWTTLKGTYGGPLGWAGGPKSPGSARVTSSVSMNEYGLYDGHYALELAWSPESGGKDNDHMNNLVTLAEWSYELVDVNYSVGFSPGADANSSSVISVSRTTTSKKLTESVVSGWKTYVDSNFQGKTLFAGSHVSVTPSAGTAHGVVVTQASTAMEKFTGRESSEYDWSGTYY